jgi:hypothetical protein
MTGSHEVRGSIPLGSTKICNKLGHPWWMPFFFCVPGLCILLVVRISRQVRSAVANRAAYQPGNMLFRDRSTGNRFELFSTTAQAAEEELAVATQR